MQRYADANGIELRMFPAEIDISGAKSERKILDEIIRLIEDGELGGIVVAKRDRLSRLKPKDRVLLFERIEDAGGSCSARASSSIRRRPKAALLATSSSASPGCRGEVARCRG